MERPKLSDSLEPPSLNEGSFAIGSSYRRIQIPWVPLASAAATIAILTAFWSSPNQTAISSGQIYTPPKSSFFVPSALALPMAIFEEEAPSQEQEVKKWLRTINVDQNLAARFNRPNVNLQTGEITISHEAIEIALKVVEEMEYEKTNSETPHLFFHVLTTLMHETSGGQSFGTGRYNTGEMMAEDIPYFKQIIDEINEKYSNNPENNPLNQFGVPVTYENIPVSARPKTAYGNYVDNQFGGAIGPAQFRPRTWMAHRREVAANPFDLYEATYAMVHKLVADGIENNPGEAIRAYYGSCSGGFAETCNVRVEMAELLQSNYVRYLEGNKAGE
jgi:hypothetical protein